MNRLTKIKDHKYTIHSQCGEEGYIMYLLSQIGVYNKFVLDIGAWDGVHLSNSKLLRDLGWDSLLIDGDSHGVKEVKEHWITSENIAGLLYTHKCPKTFDLLVFDIDGNDYDVLFELLSCYNPRIVVCEINGMFPEEESVKIKYNPDHRWKEDDYYGFSFGACKKLAAKFGYHIVFQNDSMNVYMVKKNLLTEEELNTNVSFEPKIYHPNNSEGVWETV